MFIRNNVKEGILKTPNVKKIDEEVLNKILLDNGVNSKVTHISDPHPWVMQSQYIHLDDGRRLLFKIGIEDEWTDDSAILNQVKATNLLTTIGLPQPKILAYSSSRNNYGFRFILSESHNGNRLYKELQITSSVERLKIYEALGKVYYRIHSIQNDWSGVWDGDISKKKYPIHPVDFFKHAEIYGGSNKYLLDNNLISKELYDRICYVWDKNIPYMKKRPSSLIHFSPFPWSIYIQKEVNEYTITGLTSIGDFMWWEPMIDVAHLIYPPFSQVVQEEKEAFLKGYRLDIDEKLIKLYQLLNRICAMAGCYLAPVDHIEAENWIKKEVETIKHIAYTL